MIFRQNAIRSHDVPRVITTTLSSPVSAAAKKFSLGPIAASIDSRDDAASARIYSDGPSAALRSVETASDRTQSEMESTSTSVLDTFTEFVGVHTRSPPDRSGHSVSSGQISFLKKYKEKRFPLPRVHKRFLNQRSPYSTPFLRSISKQTHSIHCIFQRRLDM